MSVVCKRLINDAVCDTNIRASLEKDFEGFDQGFSQLRDADQNLEPPKDLWNNFGEVERFLVFTISISVHFTVQICYLVQTATTHNHLICSRDLSCRSKRKWTVNTGRAYVSRFARLFCLPESHIPSSNVSWTSTRSHNIRHHSSCRLVRWSVPYRCGDIYASPDSQSLKKHVGVCWQRRSVLSSPVRSSTLAELNAHWAVGMVAEATRSEPAQQRLDYSHVLVKIFGENLRQFPM